MVILYLAKTLIPPAVGIVKLIHLVVIKSLGKGVKKMDVKLILVGLTVVFTVSCLFFGTKNGFYDSENYHGNGSAH